MINYLIPPLTVILYILINKVSKKIARCAGRPIFKQKNAPSFSPKEYRDFKEMLTKKVPGKNYNLQTSTWIQTLELAKEIRDEKENISRAQAMMFALKSVNPIFYSLALAHNFDISPISDEDYDDSPRIHEFSGYLDALDSQFNRTKNAPVK